jgi:hypothetical protein
MLSELFGPVVVFGLADLAVAVAVGVDEIVGQRRIGYRLFLRDRLAATGQLRKIGRRARGGSGRRNTSHDDLSLSGVLVTCGRCAWSACGARCASRHRLACRRHGCRCRRGGRRSRFRRHRRRHRLPRLRWLRGRWGHRFRRRSRFTGWHGRGGRGRRGRHRRRRGGSGRCRRYILRDQRPGENQRTRGKCGQQRLAGFHHQFSMPECFGEFMRWIDSGAASVAGDRCDHANKGSLQMPAPYPDHQPVKLPCRPASSRARRPC